MTALDRERIKALRNADSAVLRWQLDKPDTHVLELIKEVDRGDGFGSDRKRVQIPARALVTNYGKGWIGDKVDRELEPAIAGDWVLLSLSVNPEWATFAHFVRPGDMLEQVWVVDNRSESLAVAHVTAHEIKVRILRPTKDDRVKVFSFMLDAHAEPDVGYSKGITRRK